MPVAGVPSFAMRTSTRTFMSPVGPALVTATFSESELGAELALGELERRSSSRRR